MTSPTSELLACPLGLIRLDPAQGFLGTDGVVVEDVLGSRGSGGKDAFPLSTMQHEADALVQLRQAHRDDGTLGDGPCHLVPAFPPDRSEVYGKGRPCGQWGIKAVPKQPSKRRSSMVRKQGQQVCHTCDITWNLLRGSFFQTTRLPRFKVWLVGRRLVGRGSFGSVIGLLRMAAGIDQTPPHPLVVQMGPQFPFGPDGVHGTSKVMEVLSWY